MTSHCTLIKALEAFSLTVSSIAKGKRFGASRPIIGSVLCLLTLSVTANTKPISANHASTSVIEITTEESINDLHFPALAQSWDEGMPLGNATIGSLVWKKGNHLRMSLDRMDLWDSRPSDNLSGPNYNFKWVQEQVKKGDYYPVQQKFDHPYDQMPAPSKIPGAGMEFDLTKVGAPTHVRLLLNDAVCEITWPNGMVMQTFVQANEPVGWFKIQNAPKSFTPMLLALAYEREGKVQDLGPVSGLDLSRLGYKQGKVIESPNMVTYHQQGWEDFFYDVAIKWEYVGKDLIGAWSVTSSYVSEKATNIVTKALERGIATAYQEHTTFWDAYWAQSSVTLPDLVLQKQYNNEMYKYGSATREDSYPISLQAVWTADNGRLPPWKGDFHHDLNTQLSYWPTYTGNQLKQGLGYLNTLWNQREVYRKYTTEYFGIKEGFNVPGVATLQGEAMGGWIQYSMSPTVAAWLSQHFYLHYKYSQDDVFLKERAYPFIKDAALFLEQITIVNEAKERTLFISSSPEIYNNSLKAWFRTITNNDLALIRFCFSAAAELATELNKSDEAAHWRMLASQMAEFDTEESGALTFAKGFPCNQSHRHLSHAMAIHPLGLIDWSQGAKSQKIIKATLDKFDRVGPGAWTGYSYSWFGNLKARAMDGEGAAKALRIFAECFCSKNGFHVNGDQSGTGKSGFTYRPFTLEGNFAFASAIQEMLIQSHTGIIRLFPAIPSTWQDVSFDTLRAQGAFLVSAKRSRGILGCIEVYAEKDGQCKLALSDVSNYEIVGAPFKIEGDILILDMKANTKVTIRSL